MRSGGTGGPRENSREDARRAIEECIAAGEEIARRINTGAYLPGAADDFDDEISQCWSCNRELLHQTFDTDEAADDYGRFNLGEVKGRHPRHVASVSGASAGV